MMKIIEQEFSVRYSFPVLFSRNVFDPANPLLADLLHRAGSGCHRILAFIDSGVAAGSPQCGRRLECYVRHHSGSMVLAASPVIIAGGEKSKNGTAVLEQVQVLIGRHRLCRQSFVLAIGGGAMLDVVGFGAATAHRGVRLIRMPTTVLAQNDAGVGIKNGINGLGRKNFLGTFAPPFAVINDYDFLATLSGRDLRAGIVEAVKVALIKVADFFNFLFRERHSLAVFDRDVMEQMIYHCAALHIDHIGTQGDPFEMSSARPLDFGHWSAHKLEELTRNTINHGEAVAIGIALDSLYAFHCSMISRTQLDTILALLTDLQMSVYHQALGGINVSEALGEFQEHLGGELTITLLSGIGSKTEVHFIDEALMYRCIDMLAEYQEKQLKKLENHSTVLLSSRVSRKAGGSKSSYVGPMVINVGSR